MRAYLAALSLSLFAGATFCSAQGIPDNAAPMSSAQPGFEAVYCSGMVSDVKVPGDTFLISGEQSNYKVTFARGDYVYINRGQDKGVKVGDRFMVMREDADPAKAEWFKGEFKLLKAMGTLYTDAGQLRVVNVQPKVSIAEVTFSCGYMQRGDIVRPFEERPSPPYKDPAAFDHFAPVSGKPVGMIVSAVDYQQTLGQRDRAYINLGAAQGVKVGDYVRVFRYEGTRLETAPNTPGYQYTIYGFGSSPVRYEWRDLPREVMGEGIIINVSRNAATVLLTFSSIEIFTGDYVELE